MFFFDKQNYLLIDIVDKAKMISVVKFIEEKSNELKEKRSISCIQKICERTANCMSETITGDVIDYDEYIFAVHGNKSAS